jgi:hypothetical protein
LFGINERASELISDLGMSQTPRRRRNSYGEFIRSTEGQVGNRVAEISDEEKRAVTPAKKTTSFGTLAALRNWKIMITPKRTQICLWLLITIIRFLLMLSTISFWLCTTIAIKTLPAWNGPNNILVGFMRRQDTIRAGKQVKEDHMWGDIFPPTESFEAYNLKIALTETAGHLAPVIYGCEIPLLFRHPLVWTSLAVLSFLTRRFLSFIHECLKQAYRTTTTTSKHHSP